MSKFGVDPCLKWRHSDVRRQIIDSRHLVSSRYIRYTEPNINPRTDGGGARIFAPRKFFVDNGKPRRAAPRNLASLFLHSFYTLCANCNFLTWKVGVSLNDPSSHHHFATLRPRQSQSTWPSALKVAGCNEPIETHYLHISDFLYQWHKVRSISWPPHYKWMGGGGNRLAHFGQILVVIAIHIMDDISHDHPRLSRCDFGYVSAVRSCDVIKGHPNVLAYSFA